MGSLCGGQFITKCQYLKRNLITYNPLYPPQVRRIQNTPTAKAVSATMMMLFINTSPH